jgi:tetratricopeptide (TPR) repeat protein
VLRAAFILGFAVVLAVFASLDAFVAVAARGNPLLALRIAPRNPVALAVHGDIAWGEGGNASSDRRIRMIAEQSLSGLALNPRAIRLLGFARDADKQPQAARRLISLAEKASRRDIGTQLWLIEAAVAAGNVGQALHHYDIALLTNPRTADVLFPKLAAALDDGQIRAGLTPYVRSNTGWLSAFMDHAIWKTDKADMLAQTLLGAGGLRDTAENRSTESQLIGQLAKQAKYDAAREFFLSLEGIDRNVLQSADLQNVPEYARFAPISWRLENTSGVSAVAEGEHKNIKLRIFVSPETTGIAAQKLLFLAPGAYSFAYTTGPVVFGSRSNAYWVINCVTVNDAKPVLRDDLLPHPGNQRRSAAFRIDSACPTQLLQLVVSGGDDNSDAGFAVSAISVKPL